MQYFYQSEEVMVENSEFLYRIFIAGFFLCGAIAFVGHKFRMGMRRRFGEFRGAVAQVALVLPLALIAYLFSPMELLDSADEKRPGRASALQIQTAERKEAPGWSL
jgi:hypothetical protein